MTLRYLTLSLLALLLGACNSTLEREDSTGSTHQPPPVYQESVIISNGYANISAQLSDNPGQRRLMAIRASKIDAYRNLTEKVYGQNINATTTVEDMVATNDAIRAHVEGVIYGARLISITPTGADTYVTRLELGESQVDEIRKRFLFRD